MTTQRIAVGLMQICLVLIVSAMFCPSLTNGAVSTNTVVDFGEVVKDSPSKIALGITNLEPQNTLTLSFKFLYGGSCGFSINSQGIDLRAGQTVNVGLTFVPSDFGLCTDWLYIYYEGSGSYGLRKVLVKGTGVEAETISTVVIDGLDTGLTNHDYGDQRISEWIDECAANAKNHGKYVSCVAQLMNNLKRDGIISGKEREIILRYAAQASIPR